MASAGAAGRERPAERVRRQAGSATLALAEKARQLAASGADVIDLSGGDPDFPTPEHIRRAATQALEAGDTHYVSPAGTPALRQAIAQKLLQDNGVKVDWARGVLVTPGGKAALFEAVMAFAEPGVDVLVLEPAWVSFAPMVELAGARAVRVALSAENGFRVTREALEAVAGPSARILIVNSPNNPTGRVFDQAEREAIAQVARARDLLVFSDEIYEKVLFDGRRHVSLATLPGMAERTLTFNGFSKAYAMTGWRLGYVAGPEALVAPLLKVHGHSVTCVSGFLQAGAVAALTGPQDFLPEMLGAFDRRRRLLAHGLAAIPGVRCALPEGAIYAFADVRALGWPSAELAERLLSEVHVATVPGAAFGQAGEGFLRFALTVPEARVVQAVERLAVLPKWKRG